MHHRHLPPVRPLCAAWLLVPCLAIGAPQGIAPNPPPTAALHLRWNECYGGPNAAIDRSFSCDAETGSDELVLSFVPARLDTAIGAVGAYVDVGFGGGGPVPWWQLSSPGMLSGCRTGAARILLDPGTDWPCLSPLPDPLSIGLVTTFDGVRWTPFPHSSPNVSEQIRIDFAPDTGLMSFAPELGEVFLARLQIRHAHTTGAGTCAGCTIPMCIAFTDLMLADAGGGHAEFTPDYAQGIGWNVTWQGAAQGPGGCPGLIPARNRTWGAIKSMYR